MNCVMGHGLAIRCGTQFGLIHASSRFLEKQASPSEQHRAGDVNDPVAGLRTALGGRYDILRELGHGVHALVADFGIARALTVASGQTVTETGVAVGTPAYMSPEQATASGELDGRADIYALGCVLYEMLAGHPPFVGATAQEVLGRHALDP